MSNLPSLVMADYSTTALTNLRSDVGDLVVKTRASILVLKDHSEKYGKEWFAPPLKLAKSLHDSAVIMERKLMKESAACPKIFLYEHQMLSIQRNMFNVMGCIAKNWLQPEGFTYDNLTAVYECWKMVEEGTYLGEENAGIPVTLGEEGPPFLKVFMVENLETIHNSLLMSNPEVYRPRSTLVYTHSTADLGHHSITKKSISIASTASNEWEPFLPIEKGEFEDFKKYYIEGRQENHGVVEWRYNGPTLAEVLSRI